MPKVEIELDTLRGWFRRLENNESYEVTEDIFDTIKKYELEIEDNAKRRKEAVDAVLSQLEPSIQMNQIQLDQVYRIKKDANFKHMYGVLKGAEVLAVAKGRTNVTVRIVEPNTAFTGQQLKVAVNYLTHV